MISMVPHFVAFYFMITELTGVGYSWRSLLNWLHCCPSCLSWKLWGTLLAPNTPLLVYISSQSGCLPLFLQHSNRKFAHWSCVYTLYNCCTPYLQWEYASYHTLQYEVHWSLKCISLISRFSLLKGGISNTFYQMHDVKGSHYFILDVVLRLVQSCFWVNIIALVRYVPLSLHSHCIIAA